MTGQLRLTPAAVTFTIIGEPASKANSRKIVTFGRGDNKRAAVIKSDKARNYERDAQIQIPAHARVMFDVPVRVTMRVFYASQRPDLDESVILDVLQAKFETRDGPLVKVGEDKWAPGSTDRVCVRRGVYLNDRLVREKHVYHDIDRKNPRAEITVEPIEISDI